MKPFPFVLTAALIASVPSVFPAAATAQTANVSPTSPSGSSPGNVTRTAPSGSAAIPTPGQPQIGAPTPAERHYEKKARKDTTAVCKGC